eukprot:snap_masked-scaffold_9-processed-gene-0.33-mRNA-1 protein AED:1.00 eAED:1.00 QI:0/-1/0/0/-1/1/1/0/78
MAVLMSKGISIMAERDTVTIMKNSVTLYKADKDINNLFKIKYKTNEDKNTEDLSIKTGTLVGITKSNTSKVEFLHNKF